MNKKHIKDWTILIYANGNNELEPEILQSKRDAENVGSSENVNVVMQIGRENRELARIIRPNEIISEEDEQWTGVRRYHILKEESKLITDLGKINMADPNNLYDFIKWGMEAYPAKRYMVSLSSHGASFIAAMPDFSQEGPYMMGMPQICKAINMIIREDGNNIDILVLDMCYMNSVEIMYELGKKKENTVKNVVTYINDGPISGLPYDKLISSVEENGTIDDCNVIIRNIINNIDMDLVGIDINHGKLKKIKNKVNSLAHFYLSNEGYKKKKPYELINSLDINDLWYKQALDVQDSFKKIIIDYKRTSYNSNNIINITTFEMHAENDNIAYIAVIYYSLSFGKNNYWLNVLTTKSLKLNESINRFDIQVRLKPFMLHPTGLLNQIYAMNLSLSREELEKILNKVLVYKKWNYNKISAESTRQAEEFIEYRKNNI